MTATAGARLRLLPGRAARFRPGARAQRVRQLFLLAARLRPEATADGTAADLAADPAVAEGAAALARRTGQEPLFHHLVTKQLPCAALRGETLQDLAAHARLHALRWEDLRTCATDLLAASARKGIRPILLKGISQAGVTYDPPHLRPMRDIDVLLREEDIEAGRGAAVEAGFRADAESHPDARYASHHHLPPLFHDRLGICLEIHHHLMRLPAYFQGFPALPEFWRSTRDSPVFPGRAHLLDPAMEVLATTIHITHGDTIGRRAQNLIDLARLCEREGDAIDWTRLAALAAASADVARSLAFPLLYLAREGLPSAPAAALARIRAASGLGRCELGLLTALTHRYRIGAPAPWRLVSGRLSNILWRHAFARGWAPARAVRALRETLQRSAP
jgi:hypothetical protein